MAPTNYQKLIFVIIFVYSHFCYFHPSTFYLLGNLPCMLHHIFFWHHHLSSSLPILVITLRFSFFLFNYVYLQCFNFLFYFQFDSFGVNRTVNLTYFHYQVNQNCINYLRIEMIEIMVNRVNLIGYEEGQVDSMAFHYEELSSRSGTISPKVYWHFE